MLETSGGVRTLANGRANGNGVITTRLVVPSGGLGTVSAADARLRSARAATPLVRSAVPHGSRR